MTQIIYMLETVILIIFHNITACFYKYMQPWLLLENSLKIINHKKI